MIGRVAFDSAPADEPLWEILLSGSVLCVVDNSNGGPTFCQHIEQNTYPDDALYTVTLDQGVLQTGPGGGPQEDTIVAAYEAGIVMNNFGQSDCFFKNTTLAPDTNFELTAESDGWSHRYFNDISPANWTLEVKPLTSPYNGQTIRKVKLTQLADINNQYIWNKMIGDEVGELKPTNGGTSEPREIDPCAILDRLEAIEDFLGIGPVNPS